MKSWGFGVVLTLTAVLTSGHAEIYKWVDEQGRVHYGDKPNERAETVGIDDETASVESPVDESARHEHRQRLLQSMQRERERKQGLREQAQAAEADAKWKCAQARGQLADITNAGLLFRRNAQGEREIFTDEERAQATARAEAAVKRYCGN